MIGWAQAVAELVELSGGVVIGKTRLQKTVYFLESRRVGYGFKFTYHYYGPYCEDLALATEDAAALGIVLAEPRPSSFGIPYVVYTTSKKSVVEQDDVSRVKRAEILEVLAAYDPVTLELAATADFLAMNGYRSEPWQETIRRKSEKATPDRIMTAKELLHSLSKSGYGELEIA